MQIAVWDTYVKREDGLLMHFDILVPSHVLDEQVIFNFGRHYLNSKAYKTKNLTAKECQLCHLENASESVITDIEEKGYSIIEMENCN
jgi:hypothetical protein